MHEASTRGTPYPGISLVPENRRQVAERSFPFFWQDIVSDISEHAAGANAEAVRHRPGQQQDEPDRRQKSVPVQLLSESNSPSAHDGSAEPRLFRMKLMTSRTAPRPPAHFVMKSTCGLTEGSASATAAAKPTRLKMDRSTASSPIYATSASFRPYF